MCEWGTDEVVEVTMQPQNCPEYCENHPNDPRCQGEWKKKCKIDKCIAPIVKTLEENNVRMLASCCGHGKDDGSILLLDRTELIIPIEFTSNIKNKTRNRDNRQRNGKAKHPNKGGECCS